MQIRLQELAAMPGYRARFDYTIDLSQEEVGFEFPFQHPVRLEGEVSDDEGAITLSATIQARVTTRCARCGKPVEYDKETDVEFLLVKELQGDEDCKGLCPKCGKNLNQGDCGCVVKEVDPRLAVLQKFLDSKK